MNVDNNLYKDIIGEYMNKVDIEDNNINAGYFSIDEELGEISKRIDEVESAGP